MPAKRMTPEQIALLRETLTLSDGEFASRIGLPERQMVKLLESGAMRPSEKVQKALMKMLQRTAGRSPKLKRMLDAIRSQIPQI